MRLPAIRQGKRSASTSLNSTPINGLILFSYRRRCRAPGFCERLLRFVAVTSIHTARSRAYIIIISKFIIQRGANYNVIVILNYMTYAWLLTPILIYHLANSSSANLISYFCTCQSDDGSTLPDVDRLVDKLPTSFCTYSISYGSGRDLIVAVQWSWIYFPENIFQGYDGVPKF